MSKSAEWQQELESTGSVRIGTSMNSLIWRVGLAALIVAAFLWRQYTNDQIGQQVLYIAIAGFALLILGCVIFVRTQYGAKQLTVDRHGITNVDGNTYPWSDVQQLGVFSAPRQGDALQIQLTDDAWKRHLSKQSAAGSLVHKGNRLVTRNNSIVAPTFIDADPNELATWLSQFAQGEPVAE